MHSCVSEPAEAKKIEVVNSEVIPEVEPEVEQETEPDYYVPEKPVDRPFYCSEMPKKWWRLTVKDNSFIRYDHWDAQDETIVFSADEEGECWLEIAYPQETDSGPITNFKATITEGDGISMVKGSFTLQLSLEKTPRQISFIWNQLAYHIEFKNLYYETEYYVADESKDFFPFIETFREED